MTLIIEVDPEHPDPAAIGRAADILRRGGLVAFPTETVYGLGGHALDRAAVRRIFAAKGRPSTDPLIVHVDALSTARPLIARDPAGLGALARRFWPGPLTLVLPRTAAVPDEVTAGLDTVAIRVPAHPVASALLRAAGIPVAAPSANQFSRPSPTRAEHVLQDLRGRIDAVVDGGPTQVGVESTVLDLSGDTPTVLRPGAVTLEMLQQVLPTARLGADGVSAGAAMRSPGLLSKHYSPRAALTLYEGEPNAVIARMRIDADAATRAGRKVALLVSDADEVGATAAIVGRLGPPGDLAAVARRLYGALREMDALDVDEILVHGFGGDSGLGAAVQDRLRRAAAGRIVFIPN